MCTVVGSCYQPVADETCCGCANWDEEGVDVPPYPETQQCVKKNPTWNERIKPTLHWLKKACPTTYTYPYDDMSSTFTCYNEEDGMNIVNYQVTFCPENESKEVSE
jgi:hypothetical protein